MPVVALGFAVAPVAGQNFGARLPERVKATFKDASLMAAGGDGAVRDCCRSIAPAALVGIFTKDPAVIAVGDEYLRIMSWNYVASGLIFVASSMFQAMGNTMPSLIASAVRILLITVPAVLLSRLPGFQLQYDMVSVRGGRVRAARPRHVPVEPRIPRSAELRCSDGEGRVATEGG